MPTPSDALFNAVVFRCVICKAKMGECDCWQTCECGATIRRGKPCTDWVHSHPYAVLPAGDHYFKITEEFRVYKTYGTKCGVYNAIRSGNIFLFRKDANAAVREAKAVGITMAEWFKRRRRNTCEGQRK